MEGKRKVSTGKRTYRPGENTELTDEEILATPAKLLSQAQRKHRRMLKRRERARKSNAAAKTRREAGRNKLKYCQGFRVDGEPCSAYAVTGAKHCMSHLNDAEKAKLGLKTLPEYGTEARIKQAQGREKINPVQSMREIAEVAQDKIANRYFKALGMEFVGWDEEGRPVVIDHGAEAGIKLHGVSKEGYVEMSSHPDLVQQIAIAEKLYDRVYGRPRQTTVLEGGVRPVQVQPVRNPERAKRVAGLLHQAGAIPHEGRSRREPSEPRQNKPDEKPTTSNVTELRPNDS